jgi:hypothetical protein
VGRPGDGWIDGLIEDNLCNELDMNLLDIEIRSHLIMNDD